jgi:hypothetical protein
MKTEKIAGTERIFALTGGGIILGRMVAADFVRQGRRPGLDGKGEPIGMRRDWRGGRRPAAAAFWRGGFFLFFAHFYNLPSSFSGKKASSIICPPLSYVCGGPRARGEASGPRLRSDAIRV